MASSTKLDRYEDRLSKDLRWALSEGDRFFQGHGSVHATLLKICRRLDELGIPYAVAGGMALFAHQVRRFTEDVDILISPEGLERAHAGLAGLGYVPPYHNSKNLRDVETGVRIEFLIQGKYPGDGKPKPVCFPDPRDASIDLEGIKYLKLATLVELKLASGMTNPDRLKDIADVQALIRALALPLSFEDVLAPYVRPTFRELWESVRLRGRRFVRAFPKSIVEQAESGIANPTDAEAIADFAALREAGAEIRSLDNSDEVLLIATDPEVARRFRMEPADEWDDFDEPDSPTE